MSKIYVPLTKSEWLGLLDLSQREDKTPNELLRHLLRRELVTADASSNIQPINANSDTTRQGISVAVRA